MSSVSCVVLREASESLVRQDSEVGSFLSVLLWTIGSLFVSFNVEMSTTNTGIQVSVTVLHVLLMMVATILLGKGLKECNAYLVLPWIALSIWNMYHLQLQDIIKLYKMLLHHNLGKIPWVSLVAYSVALIIRVHLTIRVAHVALQQWYHKKLLEEMVKPKP